MSRDVSAPFVGEWLASEWSGCRWGVRTELRAVDSVNGQGYAPTPQGEEKREVEEVVREKERPQFRVRGT